MVYMHPGRYLKKNHTTDTTQGFTLIEMAMVMVIVGIVISIMMTVMPTLIKTGKIKEAQGKLAKFDYALQGYAILHLRLPYADSDGDGFENNTPPYAFVGDLPFRTLGLSDGNDVWGQPVKYAVYGAAGNSDSLTNVSADKTALQAKLTNITAAGFLSTIAYTTTSNTCAGANAGNSSNKAYVIASGGPKDLDNNNGMFELCTASAGAGFTETDPQKILFYDDLVRSFSLSEFATKVLSPY
jgi:prepilin-type N-terminal cleavage/methylation domain-containing protein